MGPLPSPTGSQFLASQADDNEPDARAEQGPAEQREGDHVHHPAARSRRAGSKPTLSKAARVSGSIGAPGMARPSLPGRMISLEISKGPSWPTTWRTEATTRA